MISESLYHKSLRVSAVLLAAVVVFQSGFIGGTGDLARYAKEQVANVIGISATVETNELNTITAELTKQREDLRVREQALTEREIAAKVSDRPSSVDVSDFILSAILLLLVILIALNYLFDFMRARSEFRTHAGAGMVD